MKPSPRTPRLSAFTALALPAACVLVLCGLSLLPRVHEIAALRLSLLGAAALLAGAFALLLAAAARQSRMLTLEVLPRKQHYIQACAQASIYVYWGWYWPPVYEHAPLIAAQLAFAYGCDALLSWSRRDSYVLGFGPFPIIFSMNLFLWFKPEWFYWQFAMVALGLAAKEFIRWDKDGRPSHIFNPSSFPLAIASLLLIATGTTHLTLGPDIAETQLRPPYIYLLIFLVALPGQFLFGVTAMTMSAVVTLYLFGVVYHAVAGTYFFFEGIPIAVFLGMHLLFTDPSTSPKTVGGRIVYGVLYALSVAALAPWVGFYDKLLQVPVLNLMVKAIDRAMRWPAVQRLNPAPLLAWITPNRQRLAAVTAWTAFFAVISSTHGIGHSSRGYWLPEWQQACREGRRNACEKLAQLEQVYCREGGSGWACNDLALMFAEGRYGDRANALPTFEHACSLGFTPACRNVTLINEGGGPLVSGPPRPSDYTVLLIEGQQRTDEEPFDLFDRACTQGWTSGCESLGLMYLEGQGTRRDPGRAAAAFTKACAAGLPTACASLAYQFDRGNGVPRDPRQAIVLLKKACDLGLSNACTWMKEVCAAAGTDVPECRTAL